MRCMIYKPFYLFHITLRDKSNVTGFPREQTSKKKLPMHEEIEVESVVYSTP